MAIDKIGDMSSAINAYKNTAGGGGMAPREGGSPSFGDLVRSATESAIETQRNSEKMAADAVVGKADLTDVVQAVSDAEVTLQTVVAIRDRVISAYQEILRMPM